MALTDLSIRNAKASDKPRKLSDGGGLHLLVTPAGGKLWRASYRFLGKQKTLALGVYPEVIIGFLPHCRPPGLRKLPRGRYRALRSL